MAEDRDHDRLRWVAVVVDLDAAHDRLKETRPEREHLRIGRRFHGHDFQERLLEIFLALDRVGDRPRRPTRLQIRSEPALDSFALPRERFDRFRVLSRTLPEDFLAVVLFRFAKRLFDPLVRSRFLELEDRFELPFELGVLLFAESRRRRRDLVPYGLRGFGENGRMLDELAQLLDHGPFDV